ncbi:MAG TPA: decaprenyl-phosphate phosphoribosyltransferase [Chloroflexia bacterium]|nr:decaprenyl-phosphate phosphoribosyltransferase [Chloroflexia bacterium]
MAHSTIDEAQATGAAPDRPMLPDPPGSAREGAARPWPLLLLKTMRPKQWSKNAVVFAALVFAFRFRDVQAVALTFAAFALFCLLSSSVYIMNDLADRAADRIHPRKRFRPLASGALSPTIATVACVVILAGTIALAFLINWQFGAICVLYFLSQIGYSFWLKHVVIIDVLLLASGFVLRAMAGALVIDVPISPWLYVCVTLLGLFIGCSKRRHELILLSEGAGSHRKILEEYSPALLDQMITVVTSSTVMAYAMYTFSAKNLPENHLMMVTIPFVLYGIFRYQYLIYQKNEGGTPEELLLRDRPLFASIVLWGAVSVAVLAIAKVYNLPLQ